MERERMSSFTQTERTRLRRLPKRGEFDREAVYSILDEGFVCHVGFNVEDKPVVIPTAYARVGERLYFHGSQASRMLRTVERGVEVCLCVTLVDGLVLARSAFHHSINYRSVVVFGRAEKITDEREKWDALHAFTEHVVPGRWREVREPSPEEMRQTTVLALALEEVSAKVRTGMPIDDEEDYSLPIWAGVVPLRVAAGTPINDARIPEGHEEPPAYATNYRRGVRRD
jgi:nitroimidazol reductase NimA-like FMN-containing flavoprotein (pyridoxamine 5'-phosphate oxidase superfamily)